MRVLIAGCGYVGSALATQLVQAGHSVFGLRRTINQLPAGVAGIAADLSDPSTLTALPEVDTLVYCAAAGGRTPENYEAAYVRGVENVLCALEGTPLTRAVLTSSTAVYAQDDGSDVDEGSPTEPQSFSGRTLLRSEALFRERLGERGVVLRLSGIYGPTRTRLVRTVAEGTTPAPPASRLSNRIHVEDCAGAIAHLLEQESPAPCYVGVDDDPGPLRDVMAFIAARIGAPWPPTPDLVADPAPERDGQPSASVTRRAAGDNKRCSNRLLRAAGYSFRYPSYRDGYPAICDEFLSSSAGGRGADADRGTPR
ncbi:MAG: NAD-dependent epimerase/dehydratase family protein [Myxococcales bacterium]|nr:NAD-dependent epimerase/dehydratase family protein [Myxococcales bacterium]MCB9627767.1 NAD-dependent epimerase/dehydratase family protein [Sandaracinaceae bacterium]